MPDHPTCALSGSVHADVWVHREDGRRSSAVLIHRAGGFVLEVHDVSVLSGLCSDAAWRSRAAELARRQQRVEIRHDGMHLLSLGALGAEAGSPTGSNDIHVGSWPTARVLLGLTPA